MRRLTWRLKTVALVVSAQMLLCQATPLFALPQGERVAGGDVTFSRQGDTLTIQQTSRKAIVNYDSFSIGSPETVHIIQPNSSATILNRVTGDQGSVIAGIMLANGNVYLINPNGILFTPSARISVASLLASALNITDEDFNAGKLLFTGTGGSVVNQGEITATQRAWLFGSTVENAGVIRAGNVLMAAASTAIEIDNAAGGAIRLIVDGQPMEKDAGTGSHARDRADTRISTDPSSDTDPVETGTSGNIQIPADTGAAVAQDAATAGMVINQGTVSASGASGGSVTMGGTLVGQFGTVNADGYSGDGGTIDIIAAGTVALGEASVTTANAGLNGNGGTITVFSPDSALFRRGAKIESRGGSETGDGGFIEVSGRQHVEIYGTADASARNGTAGTFLIDPSDVTLANSPPGDGDWIPSGGPPYTQFNPSIDTAVADIGTLLGSLQINDVIVTTANGAGTQLGNITVADAIDLNGTGGHQLSLQADNNIVINANITDTTPATPDATAISLRAHNDVNISAMVDTGGGNLSINADGDVAINADVITDGGSFISGGHDFTSSAGATITTGGGDVNMLGHSGAVSINDTIDTTGGAGQIRIYGTSITLNQNINPIVLNSGGPILLRTADITVNGGVVGPSVTVADTTGIGIGLGATSVPGGLNVSGAELQRIATAALELDTAGSITVDNITAVQSLNVDVVTLDAGTAVSFANNDSTFRALIAQADNGISVAASIATTTGNLSLDGDADNAADGSDNIAFADAVQLTSAGSITLDATTGDMTSAGALALVANNGISINDTLSGPPTSGIMLISADADANGAGTLTVATGTTINEFAGQILISANDLDLQGNLAASGILITESHGGGIGLGSTPAGMTISGSTLQHITTAGLTLGTPGSVTVNNITATDSQNAGDVIISAGSSIAFSGSSSTFNSLAARADNGISAGTDLVTDSGNLSLDGDADNAADGSDNIAFAGGVQLTSAGSITLDATTGGMTSAGALTLNAANGISTLSSLTAAGLTTLNADTDAAGGGNLTVGAGTTINAAGNNLVITANDLDLQGSLQAGSVRIIDSDGTGIGLGGTTVAGGLNVAGTELQRITTAALEMDTAGSITVNGVSAANSANAGTVTLDAGGAVLFDTAASTFNSLVVLADNGVTVNRNITTVMGGISLDGDADNAVDGSDSIAFAAGVQLTSAGNITLDATTGGMTGAGALTLNAANGISTLSSLATAGLTTLNADTDAAGGGNLTVAAGTTINSAGNNLVITADDLDLQGSLQAGSVLITDSDGTGSGLGGTAVAGGLNVSGSELQRITSTALELDTAGSITVNGITAANSANAGTVTLDAGSAVLFDTAVSTFNALVVLADDGIAVNRNITTVTGGISLDGDADNAADGSDNIAFAGGVQLTSAGSITLDATTGGMTGAGALTLNAANGISTLSSLATAGLTTLSADTDAAGGGNLSVAAGTTINSAGNNLVITANDLDLQGSLQAGSVLIADSDGTGIGLGGTAVAGGLNVSGSELQRITTAALELDTAGSITVNGVSAANSANAGTVTLDAGSAVLFDTAASTFNSLVVLADNGIAVNRDLTTVTGGISLDGDADNAMDGSDNIVFADGVQLNSAGSITLDATTGGIEANGLSFALIANSGITINDDLARTPTPLTGLLSFDADADNNGSGTFAVRSGVTVIGLTGDILITADDIDLQGMLVGDQILISESTSAGIGLGSTPTAGGLNLSPTEFRNIASASLRLETAGSIMVDNITATDSELANAVTLAAGGSVNFENNSSTFDSLTVLADNGVNVNQNVATDSGNLSFDGDADNAADGNDAAWFGNIQLDSAGSITLESTTGGMFMDGLLILNANTGVTIGSSLTGPPIPMAALLAANADADGNGSGTFTVAAGTTTDLLAGQASITANDIDLQGSLLAGVVRIYDSDGTGIGLGATPVPGGLNIDGSELQRITTPAIELDTAGPLTVAGISAANSGNAGVVTLTSGEQVSFVGNASTFQALTVLADNGIAVDANLSTAAGNLSLDGDADNAIDGNDAIRFAAGIQLTSAGSITLESTGGGMAGAGALTLTADDGISVADSLATAGLTTLAADADLAGGGDLAVAAGATIDTAGSGLVVSANDVNLQGNISAGTVLISDSDGTGIGLGATTVAGGLNIDGSELQRLATATLELDTAGSITVDRISAVNSQNTGAVTLDAGGAIAFINNESVFGALTAMANDGISVNSDLTTVLGNLSLDGDADNAVDGSDSIQFAAGIHVVSAGSITLAAATGDMAGAGELTLDANDGISVLDSLTTAGSISMNADLDAAGGGELALAAGATIDAGVNTMLIIADDVNLQGSLQAGAIRITDSDGTGMGLGPTAVAGGLNIDGGELQRITTVTLDLDTAGSITVTGVTATDSQNAGAVSLTAGGSVSFNTGPATFDALAVLADNGIAINRDLATDVGNLSLDGDADNAADGADSIRFADGVQVTAAGSLTLEATTGDMAGAGALTLGANNGIMIMDSLTTAGSLSANDDTTVAAGAVLRAGDDLTVSDGSTVRGVDALSIYAGDHLTLGGDASSAGTMFLLADSNSDGVGLLRIKGNVSTDGSVPSGTITLTGEIQVDGTMTVGAPDLSLYGADRDDVDYSIMGPIRAGGIIIRMGHGIYDGTSGESDLLLAGNVTLSARTGSIGGSGADDIDIAAGTLRASARGNIYIEEADNVRVAGGIAGGGTVDLDIHGSLDGDSIIAGNMLTITAGGTINCSNLGAGGLMDLDGAALEFDFLNAYAVDADMTGGIAMGHATLTDLADFKAGGTISDHDSMIIANDVYLIAGGNIGGSAIEMNVDRISLVSADGMVHIRQHAAGQTPLGLISAGDYFLVEVPNGGFDDGNGGGLNFRARNDSYLYLHGTCGGLCSPLQIEIDPGHLHVNGINISGADNPDGWVWISLEGELGRDPVTGSQIEYTGTVDIPGLVLFENAVVLGNKTIAEISRTEAFSMETPELKSRQGVFGSPYFLHNFMNISEPIALGVVDYLVRGLAYVNADPEFPRAAKQKITMWPRGFAW